MAGSSWDYDWISWLFIEMLFKEPGSFIAGTEVLIFPPGPYRNKFLSTILEVSNTFYPKVMSGCSRPLLVRIWTYVHVYRSGFGFTSVFPFLFIFFNVSSEWFKEDHSMLLVSDVVWLYFLFQRFYFFAGVQDPEFFVLLPFRLACTTTSPSNWRSSLSSSDVFNHRNTESELTGSPHSFFKPASCRMTVNFLSATSQQIHLYVKILDPKKTWAAVKTLIGTQFHFHERIV